MGAQVGDMDASTRTRRTHVSSGFTIGEVHTIFLHDRHTVQELIFFCTMGNFKTVIIFVIALTTARCGPVKKTPGNSSNSVDKYSGTTIPTPQTTYSPGNPVTDLYDQRQNGTENYRLEFDGLMFVFAPAQTVLLANALSENLPGLKPSDLSSLMSPSADKNKPEASQGRPPATKVGHRSSSQLLNLLTPLLRRVRQG